MIPNIPALGMLFNIEQLEKIGSYGRDAWLIFWKSILDLNLEKPLDLWEGDIARRNTFCVAVQCEDNSQLSLIKSRLENSQEFKQFAVEPRFIEGRELMNEPLVHVGCLNTVGKLSGDADELFNAQNALNLLPGDHKLNGR